MRSSQQASMDRGGSAASNSSDQGATAQRLGSPDVGREAGKHAIHGVNEFRDIYRIS